MEKTILVEIPEVKVPSIPENPHRARRRLHPCVNKHGWHNLMRKRIASAKLRKYDIPKAPRKVDLGPIVFEGLPVVSWWKRIWGFVVRFLDTIFP